MIWEECYSHALINLGFRRGIANPCCFYNEQRQLAVVVHGDDFTALGARDDLEYLEKGLSEVFELKLKGHLGEASDCQKEIRVLNRIARIDEEGVSYEADPRHVEMLVKAIKAKAEEHQSHVKVASAPGNKPKDINYETILDEYSQTEIANTDCDPDSLTFSLQPSRLRKQVSFAPGAPQVFEVKPYCEMFPFHPREIVVLGPVTLSGSVRFTRLTTFADPFSGKREAAMAARKMTTYPPSRIENIRSSRFGILKPT